MSDIEIRAENFTLYQVYVDGECLNNAFVYRVPDTASASGEKGFRWVAASLIGLGAATQQEAIALALRYNGLGHEVAVKLREQLVAEQAAQQAAVNSAAVREAVAETPTVQQETPAEAGKRLGEAEVHDFHLDIANVGRQNAIDKYSEWMLVQWAWWSAESEDSPEFQFMRAYRQALGIAEHE